MDAASGARRCMHRKGCDGAHQRERSIRRDALVSAGTTRHGRECAQARAGVREGTPQGMVLDAGGQGNPKTRGAEPLLGVRFARLTCLSPRACCAAGSPDCTACDRSCRPHSAWTARLRERVRQTGRECGRDGWWEACQARNVEATTRVQRRPARPASATRGQSARERTLPPRCHRRRAAPRPLAASAPARPVAGGARAAALQPPAPPEKQHASTSCAIRYPTCSFLLVLTLVKNSPVVQHFM